MNTAISALTAQDVARYPHYYLGYGSPGRKLAEAAWCPHTHRLTETCPECAATIATIQPVCGPPPGAEMTDGDEIWVRACDIEAWRKAGPGSWLVALPGQIVIRRDEHRAPGAVEIAPYSKLAEITAYLAEAAGGARPADRDLAARFTDLAGDRLPTTRDLDYWYEQASALDHAMAAAGLGRDSSSAVRRIAHDPPVTQWQQAYARRGDGTSLGVTLSAIRDLTSGEIRLLVTVTAHAVTATADLPHSPDVTTTARVIARAACRHLDGLHPGPVWNATGLDRHPADGHPLWRATHAVLGHVADLITGGHLRHRHDLGPILGRAVAAACASAACPPAAEAWIHRQATFRILAATRLPTCGPRDARNPALLALVSSRFPQRLAAEIWRAAYEMEYLLQQDRS